MGYREGRFWKVDAEAAHALDHRLGWTGCRLLSAWPSSSASQRPGTGATSSTPASRRRSARRPSGREEERYLTQRTADGSYNDLEQPAMGMAGSRFGRNLPADVTLPEPEAEFMTPDPRVVSGSC